MAEYIEREILLKKNFYTENCNSEENRWNDYAIKDIIMHIPAADVVPVKHGHWIEEYDCGYITPHCSECGETALTKEETSYDYVYSSYCPRCGAKMDGGEQN